MSRKKAKDEVVHVVSDKFDQMEFRFNPTNPQTISLTHVAVSSEEQVVAAAADTTC